MASVVDAIKDGQSILDIVQASPTTFIRYHHGIEKLHALLQPAPQRADIRVCVLWGRSGVGKSRMCPPESETTYWWSPPQNGHAYATGYAEQRVVVFDEFTGWMQHGLLLRLLDRYPLTVNTMGGVARFLGDTIFLTSNQHPRDWYPNVEYKDPLLRRIHHLIEVTPQNVHMAQMVVTGMLNRQG